MRRGEAFNRIFCLDDDIEVTLYVYCILQRYVDDNLLSMRGPDFR